MLYAHVCTNQLRYCMHQSQLYALKLISKLLRDDPCVIILLRHPYRAISIDTVDHKVGRCTTLVKILLYNLY